MLGLRPMEIVLILAVVLLLFGATRLPQLGSSLGSAIRNFKRGFGGEEEAPASGEKKPSSSQLATGERIEQAQREKVKES